MSAIEKCPNCETSYPGGTVRIDQYGNCIKCGRPICKIAAEERAQAAPGYGLREELEVYAKCISVLPSGKGIGDNLLEMIARHPVPAPGELETLRKQAAHYKRRYEAIAEEFSRQAAPDGLREYSCPDCLGTGTASFNPDMPSYCDRCKGTGKLIIRSTAPGTPAAKEEPLEELAKRKGLGAFVQVYDHKSLRADKLLRYFPNESDARAFLDGLPDKDKENTK